jgi:8-amino-7-oxononanoate synthase
LFDAGVFVNAVLPPAVARDSARLRVSVTSEHSESELDHILSAFSTLARVSPEAIATPVLNEAP